MKDDLISTVSHELRTPLATIRGFTELLGPSSDVTDDVRVQVIDRIRRGTHRLERLVANLLEVSRIEGRRSSTAPPADLDLHAIVHDVVEEVRESWPDRQIDVGVVPGAGWVRGNLLDRKSTRLNSSH